MTPSYSPPRPGIFRKIKAYVFYPVGSLTSFTRCISVNEISFTAAFLTFGIFGLLFYVVDFIALIGLAMPATFPESHRLLMCILGLSIFVHGFLSYLTNQMIKEFEEHVDQTSKEQEQALS